ncbi:hypothetical protein OG458_42870 (plasmid) [Streptomyces sp. NBC_01281]|uniref:hypothetical protein n=1 Tax=Streptomyces sp. NBC_01281 TaxID=2903811 RepID=UPI002E1395FD|nr:hypothetical protein OG458_42870 [Streptomyces sp. NBC_01281]
MDDETRGKPQGPLTDLRPVWFTVMPYVPAGTNRKNLAQQLADHLRTLTRRGTGEQYPSAAEVFLVSSAELQGPGQEVPHLLVHGWAERPWQQDDERRMVVTDFFEAVHTWFLSKLPVSATPSVFCTPVRPEISEKLVSLSDFAAHTMGALPAGWAERIPWHGALLPMDRTS